MHELARRIAQGPYTPPTRTPTEQEDAVWAAPIFCKYDPYQVKHTVADETQVDRTHPLFYNIAEQFESMANAIEELRPREAYIKLRRRLPFIPSKKTVRFRSITIPKRKATWQQIQRIRDHYAQVLLCPIEPPLHIPEVSTARTISRPRVG
jgi:hypothetical protein